MSAAWREIFARSLGAALGLALGGVVARAGRDDTWALMFAAAPATGGLLGIVYAPRLQRGAPLASVAVRMGGAAVFLGAVLTSQGNLGAALLGVALFGPFFLTFTVVTALVWAWLTRSVLRIVDPRPLVRELQRADAR